MVFCDRERVRTMFEGRHVALVGSGPGVLGNARGFVDSHDVVVRVNNYRVTGGITGRRTDVFYSFFGSSIRKRVTDLQRDGVQLCMAKCPNAQVLDSDWHRERGKMNGVDFRYIYSARAAWWFCDTWVPPVEDFMRQFELLGGRVPTTGFAALLDVLSHNPASVFMTGFDFFRSKLHNVNERWKPGNPSDPIGHDPEAERAWLLANFERLPVQVDAALAECLNEPSKPEPAQPVVTEGSQRVAFRPRLAGARR